MTLAELNQLREENLISDQQHETLRKIYTKEMFSVFYELRTMLYLGVLLFTTGIGVLVYQNIDTIGHQVIIFALTILMLGCFWYVWKRKLPFSRTEVQSPGVLFDYILLLGALLFATIIGYIQFQYAVFGERWELAALLPAMLYFPLAYLFDHRGVLSLGITGIASWLGLTVSPVGLMEEGLFRTADLIYTGIAFGFILMAAGLFFGYKGFKKHFTFTYMISGFLVFGAASLSGLFVLDNRWMFFFFTAGLCTLGIIYAKREQSFFFLLMSAVSGYVAVTYLLSEYVSDFGFWELYFILSCGAMIVGLFKYKTFLAR